MARARNIKPGLYKNEDLAECSVWARYIFPGLWMQADREGRLEDRPKRLKGELLPFDAVDIEPLLAELDAHRFILRYSNEQGSFIQILKFGEHQSPHYSEKPSSIKPPSLRETVRDKGPEPPRELPDKPPHQEVEKPREHPEGSAKEGGIKRGSQPPDSLIPDSLIPDSRKKRFPDANHIGDSGEAVTALRLLCETSRVTVNVKARMHLAQWVQEGVSDSVLSQAIVIARERKPDPALIPFAYLVPIVEDLKAGRVPTTEPRGKEAIPEALERIAERERREAARPTNGHHLAEPEWWETPAGIQREGLSHGITPDETGDYPDFVARVYVAAGEGPWMQHAAPKVQERLEHWRTVGVSASG